MATIFKILDTIGDIIGGTFFLIWVLFFLVALFVAFSVLHRRVLKFIPIAKNKFLKPVFLKFIYAKPIAKRFLLENKKEIVKTSDFKNLKDKQIINLFKQILISTYKEAIEPLPFNYDYGGLKKPDDNYFQNSNLPDLKFNFIKMGECYADNFQENGKDIVKKYIQFCKNIIFENK